MSTENQEAAGQDPSFYPYTFSPAAHGIPQDIKLLRIRVELIDPESGNSLGVFEFDVPREE